MRWFKRLIAKWANEGQYYGDENVKMPSPINMLDRKGPDTEFKNPMNITLYNAVGGRIVRFSRYDRSIDEVEETTYIIPSDEDFEEALGKCITMEALKHVQ